MELATEYRELVDAMQASGVRLVAKSERWHQQLLHHLLRLVTLGGQSHYRDAYLTTIGRTIYLPDGWEARPLADRYAILRHEQVHLRQFERFGVVPMAIAYLLLPLPFGLAWCRMALERAAYEESVRVAYALGGRAATDRMRAQVIRQFTGGAYGWMWPFPRALGRWYDALVARLETS